MLIVGAAIVVLDTRRVAFAPGSRLSAALSLARRSPGRAELIVIRAAVVVLFTQRVAITAARRLTAARVFAGLRWGCTVAVITIVTHTLPIRTLAGDVGITLTGVAKGRGLAHTAYASPVTNPRRQRPIRNRAGDAVNRTAVKRDFVTDDPDVFVVRQRGFPHLKCFGLRRLGSGRSINRPKVDVVYESAVQIGTGYAA